MKDREEVGFSGLGFLVGPCIISFFSQLKPLFLLKRRKKKLKDREEVVCMGR